MRKYLLALAVGLLAASLAAPSYAADFKYTGFFRLRGITADDFDRNDNINSGFQYMDALVRPRFTATSEGGKIVAIYELDYISDFGGANHIYGSTTGDQGVGINRWMIDFAIPGTTLRGRVARTDYTDPSREIFDSTGLHRQDGIAVYGKLAGPVSLSAFTTKLNEGITGGDADNYYVALKFQAAPQIAITPWVALSTSDGTLGSSTNRTGNYDRWYYALHGQAKVGIMDLQVTGVLEDGKHINAASGSSDTDLSAYAILVRSWFTFGKLKLGGFFTYLTGDDSGADFEGFVFPTQAGGVNIPNVISGVRYSTITRANTGTTNNIFSNATAQGTGSCSSTSCRLNGMMIAELLAQYNVNPSLDLVGNISYVRSAEKITTAGFTSDKDFGWVVEGGAKWKIYKQLQLWMFASYVFAGDYGRTTTGGSPDDTWALYYEFRHSW